VSGGAAVSTLNCDLFGWIRFFSSSISSFNSFQ
jgi:hypothetical protein